MPARAVLSRVSTWAWTADEESPKRRRVTFVWPSLSRTDTASFEKPMEERGCRSAKTRINAGSCDHYTKTAQRVCRRASEQWHRQERGRRVHRVETPPPRH